MIEMTFLRFYLVWVFFGMLSLSVYAQDNVVSKTLSNGLTVVVVSDSQAPIVSARVIVKTGSIDEGERGPGLGSGVSHYLEHLVAGGSTTRHPESYYEKKIAELGGASNAYTTYDHTAYFINTVPNYTNEAIQILSEWLFDSDFTEPEFKRERGVIIKEMERSNASIPRRFYESAQKNFYHLSPLRHPIIGYLSQFKGVTSAEVKAYYRAHYVPASMILVVGGPVDSGQIFSAAEKYFGTVNRGQGPQRLPIPEPMPLTKRVLREQGNTQVEMISLRFSSVDLFSSDLYPLDLLSFMLGNGRQSILYRKFVEEEGLAYSVSSESNTPAYGTGFFEITAEIKPEDEKRFLDELETLLSGLGRFDFSEEAIARAKKQKIAENILGVSSIEDKVQRAGDSFLQSGGPDFFDCYAKNFKSVSSADLQRVAQQYIQSDKGILTVFEPKGTTVNQTVAAISASENGMFMQDLANGVHVIFMPDASLDKVSIQAYILGGLRAESPENNGIGSLLMRVLGQGAEGLSKDQITRQVEGAGAYLGGAMGVHTFSYGLRCLSESLPTLFPVFAQTLLHPVFDASVFELEKKQMLKSIQRRQDDWFSQASYLSKKEFLPGHAYGLPVEGEISSVQHRSVTDISNWYAGLFDPRHTVIVVQGKYDQYAVEKLLNEWILPWKSTPPFPSGYTFLRASSHPENQLFKFPLKQSVGAVLVSYDSLKLGDNRQLVVQDLMDALLSGMRYPSGRLHRRLRGDQLVYEVHALSFAGIEAGYFGIYALTAPEKVEPVTVAIDEEIQKFLKADVSDSEFEDARREVAFEYRLRQSDSDDRVRLKATQYLLGQPADMDSQRLNWLTTVSKAEVKNLAKTILRNAQVYQFRQVP